MGFMDFMDAVSDDIWEEKPVNLETFVYDKKFLDHPRLSDIQFDIAERMSQILKKDTLIDLWGEAEGNRLWSMTKMDLVLILAKGSGKNTITQIAFMYIVYLLLCMKSPQKYYNRPLQDNIDLVNMATSSRQAVNGFFNKITAMFNSCNWFNGKFRERTNDLRFNKSITLHSLHSSPEGAEALNIMAACLDEVDSPEIDGQEMYDYIAATVTSRYEDIGKVAMLSFPRSKDGFIMKFFDDVVKEKEITHHQHTYKLNNDLEDGVEGNEFTIHWTEEIATGYKLDNTYCAKYPAYKVNPTKTLETYKSAVYKNEEEALMRFFAQPPDSANGAFFKNHEKLERVFSHENGYSHDKEEVMYQEEPGKEYFIHVDLSRVADRTVVAMSHIVDWQIYSDNLISSGDPVPNVKTDLFRVWEPTKSDPVDHGEVAKFIVELAKKFNVHTVSFDSWGIHGMIEYLTKVGINAVKQSLARPEYQEFAILVGEERLEAPYDERLLTELKGLVLLPTGKVDHPTIKSFNDITEAVCGSSVMAVRNSIADSNLKVVSLGTIRRDQSLTQAKQHAKVQGQMPGELSDWIRQLDALNSKSKPND